MLLCVNSVDGSYMESDLACLTNTGEVHVYTIPHLRRQLRNECVSRDNIMSVDYYFSMLKFAVFSLNFILWYLDAVGFVTRSYYGDG